MVRVPQEAVEGRVIGPDPTASAPLPREIVEPHDARALARLLDRAARVFVAAEREALAPYGIGPAAFRLLDLVARSGPLAPGDAAARLAVRQPTVSGWIGELRDAGLLERVSDGGDGRRATLRMTTYGGTVHAGANVAIRRRQLRLADAIPPHLQADLMESLDALVRAGEPSTSG